MRLVLFDIDGTLLSTDGAGRRAIHRALREVFGTTGPSDYWFDGKTDPQIVRDLMGLAGHEPERIERDMEDVFARYVTYLREELRAPGYKTRLFPGVRELLDALEARVDIVLGLLTGNLETGARVKLESVGIDPARFRVGAFGSDNAHRPELPAIARDRTKRELGHNVLGERIFVIGDTPHDITCGRSLGASAIAVATGRYTMEQLAEYQPVAVFRDLSDTDAVVRVIARS